eukprot:scaffold115504_cov48-Phaeocystis_antarctica.AAC.2
MRACAFLDHQRGHPPAHASLDGNHVVAFVALLALAVLLDLAHCRLTFNPSAVAVACGTTRTVAPGLRVGGTPRVVDLPRRSRWAGGSEGGTAAAAKCADAAADGALVVSEEDRDDLLSGFEDARPHHLALMATLDLAAAREGLGFSLVEHLLAHLVAARQRRRRIAAHLRTQPLAVRSTEV